MIRHGISEYNDYIGYTLIDSDSAIAEGEVALDLNGSQAHDCSLLEDIKYLVQSQHKLDMDRSTVNFINNVISYLRSYVEYTAIDSDNHWNPGDTNINAAIYLSSDILDYLQDDISRLRDVLMWYTEPSITTHLHIDVNNKDEGSLIITIQNHVQHISIDNVKNDLTGIEDKGGD